MTLLVHLVEAALYLAVGVISLLMAGKGLFSMRMLPFHEKASGTDWDTLSPGVRSVVIALLRSTGLGFLIVALLCAGLAVLRAAGVYPHIAATWSLLPLLFCAGLARINYRLTKETGAGTPWKGSLYAAAAVLIAGVMTLLSGCTTSSMLSDAPRAYPWLPPRTPYRELVDNCRGDIVEINFRDGLTVEGTILGATADSVQWLMASGVHIRTSATRDIVSIRHGSHLIPAIAGTLVGAVFLTYAIGLPISMSSAESGGAHPVAGPDWPFYFFGAAGGVCGFFVGDGYSTWHEYIVPTDSVQLSPESERTPEPRNP